MKKYDKDKIAETAMKYNVRSQERFNIEDYYARPDEKRAELIDGVFYDMSAPSTVHQSVLGNIWMNLKLYVQKKRGTCKIFLAPVDVQLDCDEWTMVQPDVTVVCKREKVKVSKIYGAPDFIAEILSPSSVRLDTVVKLEKYREAGVREYWIVDLVKEKILVYDFQKEKSPVIYGMESQVPVGIFDGDCVVDFRMILEEIRELQEEKQIS